MTLQKSSHCSASGHSPIIISPSNNTNACMKTYLAPSVDLSSTTPYTYDVLTDSVRNVLKNILGSLIKSLVLIAEEACPQRGIFDLILC